MKSALYLFTALCCLLLLRCSNRQPLPALVKATPLPATIQRDSFNNKATVVHVMVALCDNRYQGIVPVPKAIGNGKDPANNLYWGCDYGIKTFFKKRTAWKLVQTWSNPATHVLERCLFKHSKYNSYLVADAYDGQFIQPCTVDFLDACAGKKLQTITHTKDTLGIAGNAHLVAYIGHDGLMDFSLPAIPAQQDNRKRNAIILACKSKQFFGNAVRTTGAYPLLWTTQLMCPEAYTLDAALHAWLQHQNNSAIHTAAARAYSQYQHCSVKAAQNLLATGF